MQDVVDHTVLHNCVIQWLYNHQLFAGYLNTPPQTEVGSTKVKRKKVNNKNEIPNERALNKCYRA